MKTDYKLEYLFPLMFRIIGVTLTISGVLLLVTFPYRIVGGISLFIIGLTMAFTRKGVILEYENKKIKEYIGLFFIKLGKWKSISTYTDVSVLMMNIKSTGFSRTGLEFTERSKVYRIYFMDENHRERLRVKDFEKMEIAISNAKVIAKKMEKTFAKYNPK
ncbi:hypothetical protein [Flagellimonas marinaquae]|uniref:hypothetical protein n=1 Tax=Flagellimonas marinaquae TaxID=254955 RepID=UPI000F8ED8C4|nr:hypothetical protein [Allomuricauda aquimarina]